MAAGFLKLGKFIRIVPHPVMLGFVNGLAVVILLAQLGSFQTLDDQGTMVFLSGSRLWLMLGLVAITMAIIAFLPRLTKVVPSSLAAILLVSGVAHVVNSDTGADGDQPRPLLTVGDMLYSSTVASAVQTAQDEKNAAMLSANSDRLPEGLTAVFLEDASPKPSNEAELAEAVASVDPASVGIAGGFPRPAWWVF